MGLIRLSQIILEKSVTQRPVTLKVLRDPWFTSMTPRNVYDFMGRHEHDGPAVKQSMSPRCVNAENQAVSKEADRMALVDPDASRNAAESGPLALLPKVVDCCSDEHERAVVAQELVTPVKSVRRTESKQRSNYI